MSGQHGGRAKRNAVVSFLRANGKLLFPDDVSRESRERLTARFAESLVESLDRKHTRRNPASEWMLGNSFAMLHRGRRELDAPLFTQQPHNPPILHIYPEMDDDDAAGQLESAYAQARAHEPLGSNKRKIVALESDYDEEPPQPVQRPKRARYDHHAETLPSAPKAHTYADTYNFGKMRNNIAHAQQGAEEQQSFSKGFEENTAITQDMYEKILEKPASGWLWQKIHAYLLDPNTIAKKTPVRWFRDMCVLCGISTPVFRKLSGQSRMHLWEDMTTSDGTPNYQRWHHFLREALAIVNDKPLQCGRLNNPNEHYTIPTGAVFGLPVIQQDGKDIVDCEAIEDILKLLFVNHYRPPDNEMLMQALRHTRQVADAFEQGAITFTELKAHDIPMCYFIQQHKMGLTFKNASLSKALRHYPKLVGFIIDINDEILKMPEQELGSYVKAFSILALQLQTTAIKPLEEAEALALAKLHHDGTVSGFLKLYRRLRGITMLDIASKHGMTRQNVDRYEKSTIARDTVVQRALLQIGNGYQNMWELPVDSEQRIRTDVLEYLTHFEEQSRRVPVESHWMNVSELGMPGDMPAHGAHAMHVLRERQTPLTAALTELLAQHKNIHPNDPFPVISLPGGGEVLVKAGEYGEPQLLRSQLEQWRKWAAYIENEKGTAGLPPKN